MDVQKTFKKQDMEDTYLIEGELAFRSYEPAHLKVGMHFLSKITVGIIEPQANFFTLEHVPEDEELFMSLYGAPVKLIIVSLDGEEGVLATNKEIGWFEDSEKMVLHHITDQEINKIINEYDGKMDLECTEDGDIILYEGKVIISYLSSPEEEEGEEVEDGNS
jgi:hypothetical protein